MKKRKHTMIMEMKKSLEDLERYQMIEQQTDIMKFIIGMFLYPNFEQLTEYNGFLTEV